MSGPIRASGYPNLGSNSTSGFNPEVWSGKLVEKLYASTAYAEISNTLYEG